MIYHIKKFLRKFPLIYELISTVYHELNYYFSKVMLKNVYPRLRVIRFTHKDLDLLRSKGFYSQFGQDYYIVTNFFSGVTKGIFLDVGCNHAFYNSNTAYLEYSLLWTGVSCDPVAYHEHAWSSSRRSVFLPIALGKVDGERDFVEIDNADGWSSMMSSFFRYGPH